MQLVGGEDVDDAAAVAVDLQQVVDVERGFAEELVAALLLERDQTALDRADAGGGDVAVLGLVLLAALSPTCCSIARRSLRSSSSSPWSSAILKTRVSTPAWVSLRLRMRPRSSGPISRDGGADGMALLRRRHPRR